MYGIELLLYYLGHNNYGTSMLTWRRSLAMLAHVDLYLNDGRSGSLIHKENVVNFKFIKSTVKLVYVSMLWLFCIESNTYFDHKSVEIVMIHKLWYKKNQN